MDRIALSEDAEISAALHRQLTREGWKIHISRRVKSTCSEGEEAALEFEDGEILRASKIMIAVGRQPSSRNLNLERAGIVPARGGWIQTDEFLQAAPDIYAVGDVNKRALLANAAEDQAVYAVRHALGREKNPYSGEALPSCIFGHHEIMHVGPHTEALLKQYPGHRVAVSRSGLVANPIAQSYGATQGEVKITWMDERVHSVAAWGYGVSHFAPIATAMVREHWQKPEILFAHPTLEESLKSALLAPKEETRA
jgi:dihydrolipoamide dehydrogenase